jgi:predicted amidophosphoribosyltransferase
VTYCPRGETQLIRKSQTLVRQLKENRMLGAETAAAFVARRLKEMAPDFVAEFLWRDVALVPVPRSSLQKSGALWPALEIATELRALGLGCRVIPCLKRNSAVTKAATAAPNERPKAREQFESLELINPLDLPTNITLVDDVITRGAQMLGAAWCVWALRPDVTVRGFAVIRTISSSADFSTIAAPCVGSVTFGRDDESYRSP